MGSWEVAEKGWRKGPWTPEEDKLLVEYVSCYGEGRWSSVSKCAGTYAHACLFLKFKSFGKTLLFSFDQ